MITLNFLFVEGTDLNILQMFDRSVIIFFVTLILIRAAGRRAFGQQTSFDACTTVLLGAVLSRAIVGASPFVPTVIAASTLVLLHRAVALARIRWKYLEKIVSGDELKLAQQGEIDFSAMRKGLVTEKDLKEAIRKNTGNTDIEKVAEAVLERDGKITIIEKPS